jgi:hypothetical protein
MYNLVILYQLRDRKMEPDFIVQNTTIVNISENTMIMCTRSNNRDEYTKILREMLRDIARNFKGTVS